MPLTAISSDVLHQAEHFANRFLNREQANVTSNEQAVVHHHHHHYDRGWYYWGWGRPAPVFIERKSDAQAKRDGDTLLIVAVTVAALVASFLLGHELGTWSEMNHRLNYLQEQKFELDQCPSEERGKVRMVVRLEEQMVDEMRSDAKTGVLLKGAFVASMVAIAGGTMASAAGMATGGAIGGLASLAALLVRWGFSDVDTSMKEQAVHLLHAVNAARE